MGNAGVAFYVLGALLTLYIVAATWRSKDAPRPGTVAARPAVHRRLVHAWRARRRDQEMPRTP